jgi:hypothetical protein
MSREDGGGLALKWIASLKNKAFNLKSLGLSFIEASMAKDGFS